MDACREPSMTMGPRAGSSSVCSTMTRASSAIVASIHSHSHSSASYTSISIIIWVGTPSSFHISSTPNPVWGCTSSSFCYESSVIVCSSCMYWVGSGLCLGSILCLGSNLGLYWSRIKSRLGLGPVLGLLVFSL